MAKVTITDERILGAITWWYYHPDRLQEQYETGFPPTNLQVWYDLQARKVDGDEIALYAGIASSKGTSLVRLQEMRFPIGAKLVCTVRGLPKIESKVWAHVDGTMAYSEEDQAERFAAGPSWSRNSCALDCFLAVGLLAEGGRCRADQVDTYFLQDIAPLAQAIQVFRKPWGLLEADDISKLRDAIRVALLEYSPKHFPSGGNYSLGKIFEVLGLGMPQLCATWSSVMRCCKHSQWRACINEDGSLQSYVQMGIRTGMIGTYGWEISGKSVQDAIQICLGPSQIPSGERPSLERCGMVGCSGESGESMPLLLDRPPPMLVLGKGFEVYRGVQEGTFENQEVEFSYWGATIGERTRVRYEPWGWIKYSAAHYTLYATRHIGAKKEFVRYDGMTGGKFERIPSLESGVEGGGQVLMMYKMMD